MSIQALILIALFMLIIAVSVYALFQHHKLYGHYFNFWIVLFVISVPIGAAHEEVSILEDPGFAEPDPGGDIEIPIDPGPLVFPEEMPKASYEILIDYYGLMGEFNVTNFDQEWLEFLNQTNLTA
jgi:hypothetical protein